MEIFILIMMILVVCFQFCLLKTFKDTQKVEKIQPKTEERPKKAELTEEQKQKQEKLREHFENLMGFDYEKALKSKGE